MIARIVVLDLDLVGDKLCIMPSAPDKGRPSPSEPWKAEEINPSFFAHTALMDRAAAFIKGVSLKPRIIQRIPRGPKNCRDPVFSEVQVKDRVHHALWIRWDDLCLWLFGKVQAVRRDKGVCFFQNRQVVRIATVHIVDEVIFKPHGAVGIPFGHANEGQALMGEPTEIHGLAALGPADRNGDVFGARVRGVSVPFVQNAEPPNEIAVPISTRRAVVRTDGQIDFSASFAQFLSDLSARRPSANNQNGPLGQLFGIVVAVGMHLKDRRIRGDHGRNDRFLERTRRCDDMAGLNLALRGFNDKARTAFDFAHSFHFDARADRGAYFLSIGHHVIGNVLFTGEGVRVAVEFEVRKTVMPCGAIHHERVPAFRPPPLCNAVSFEDDMFNTVVRQVFACRDASLSAANHNRIDNFHLCSPNRCPDPRGRIWRTKNMF